MNNKLRSILHTTWNEPRPFFSWLALGSICGCVAAAGGVALGGPEALLGCVALGCVAFFLFSFPPFRVAACFVALITLFYSIEDFRGWKAWRSYQRTWEARGERFDLASFVPAPVPDDQNFFETPLWEPLRFSETNGSVVWHDPNHDDYHTPFRVSGPDTTELPSSGNWPSAKPVDLAAWQAFYRGASNQFTNDTPLNSIMRRYRVKGPPQSPMELTATNYFPISKEAQSPAADVLLALSKYETNRQLLLAASARPQARFWVNYNAGVAMLLPHLSKLKASSQYLSLHASAELKNGDKDTALQDVKLMLRLIESIRNEPVLISYLVRMAMLPIGLQPVWEGMADRRWNDADLSAIEADLARLDFLSDYHSIMRGERACNIWVVDWFRTKGLAGFDTIGMSAGGAGPFNLERFLGSSAVRLLPAGWFDQNKLSLCRMHEKYALPLVDRATGIVPPARVQNANTMLAQEHLGPYNLFSRMLIPALPRCAEKCASIQSSVNLARVACALERYRLANGQFPATLEALAPKFIAKLPHDMINGEPLKYRRTEDGQFVLYSVGWNEKDDGGTPGLTVNGRADWTKGDWVWRYPAK